MKALISRFNAEYITVARDSSGNITSPSNAWDFIDHIKDLKKKDSETDWYVYGAFSELCCCKWSRDQRKEKRFW
jgi:hypothetical protein